MAQEDLTVVNVTFTQHSQAVNKSLFYLKHMQPEHLPASYMTFTSGKSFTQH